MCKLEDGMLVYGVIDTFTQHKCTIGPVNVTHFDSEDALCSTVECTTLDGMPCHMSSTVFRIPLRYIFMFKFLAEKKAAQENNSEMFADFRQALDRRIRVSAEMPRRIGRYYDTRG